MRKDDSREKQRLFNMSVHERRLYDLGFVRLAGVDEAGRGPLAGPVVAAACILPKDYFLSHLNDSKLLSSDRRSQLFETLTSDSNVYYGIGEVSVERIDEINILRATFEAMMLAVQNLPCVPDYLLIDGNQLPPIPMKKEAIVRGDSASVSIAAASIIAKVSRDRLMEEEAKKWPQYGFELHKGYGTAQHLEMIRKLGPCPIHRKSFEPIRSLLTMIGH